MSQEIVRALPPSNPQNPLAQQDAWLQQQAQLATGPQAPPVQPLQILHRSLRGRYHWAAILGLAGGLLGTAIGWGSYQQKFRAAGIVYVVPEIRSPLAGDTTQSFYTNHMNSEASKLDSDQTLADAALSSKAWKDSGAKMSSGQFTGALRATYPNNSQEIRLTFDAADGKTAVAGVNASIAAYIERRATEARQQAADSIEIINKERGEVQAQIENAQNSIVEIAKQHGTQDLGQLAADKRRRLSSLEEDRERSQTLLEQMQAAKIRAGGNNVKVDPQRLAARDPGLNRLMAERNDIARDYMNMKRRVGVANPNLIDLGERLKDLDLRIDEYAKSLSAGIIAIIPRPEGTGDIEVTEFGIQTQTTNVENLAIRIDRIADELRPIEDARFDVDKLTRTIKQGQDKLEDLDRRAERFYGQALTVAARATPAYSNGSIVSEDRRPTMAIFGGALGVAFPVLAVFLTGLADRRYRYSDEATQTAAAGTRGIPLLGILPNLPDRLSDPSQASVAAHCVHQIRTMLQLNVLGDQSAVLAVTSATSGDGKTSLTLALGLSFAASGSRTLLIDTDLIGAGLSARLGVSSPTGIIEAINARDPMTLLRDTDVPDLAILPVGTAGVQQASAFSPNAVRRLFTEYRKHFDIILVDTGPVLGSIEATPLVAGADATIITVARNQKRDLVEKAVTHLRAVGAKIAGVVFNRAASGDFERSISGISLRSVSRAQSKPQNGRYEDNAESVVNAVRGE